MSKFKVLKKDLRGKNNLIVVDVSAIMRTGYRDLAEDGKIIGYYTDRMGKKVPKTVFVASSMVNGERMNTSGIYQLLRVFDKFGADNDYVFCFDTPKNILKTIDSNYKANRVKMGNEYFDQVATMRMWLSECGYKVISVDGYEGDHGVHEAVKQNYDRYDQIFVYTNDKDLSSLVSEKTTFVDALQTRTDINMDNYEEVLKCPYNSILLMKCLVGDSSDEIKGIPRFGPVKFKKFIAEELTTDMIVRGNEVDIIKNSKTLTEEQKEQAIHCSRLVLPLEMTINALAVPTSQIDIIKMKAYLEKYEINSILKLFNRLDK